MCESSCEQCNDQTRQVEHAEATERLLKRRYSILPIPCMAGVDGSPPEPAPFLMNQDEVVRFFRLHDSKTKFTAKTIQRYRRMGLKTVRIGRRVWFRLDDVLRFSDQQQDRLSQSPRDMVTLR